MEFYPEEKMRLFIAIELDDSIKKTITGTMHELKKSGVRGAMWLQIICI